MQSVLQVLGMDSRIRELGGRLLAGAAPQERAFLTLIHSPPENDFEIFHLASFNSNIQKVSSEIAMRTGAPMVVNDSSHETQVTTK